MAVKQFAILALAGKVIAQMSNMDMDNSATYTTATGSGVVASMSTDVAPSMSVSSGGYGGNSASMAMEPSISNADMTDVSSMATGTGTMADTPIGTGVVIPNATGTGQTPATGAGVMNGVSVGLFVVSVALTILT